MATNRRPEGWKNSSEYELVEKDGKFFTVAELPENLRTSKYLSSRVKECYRNAATLVLDNPDQYIYCEGFSTSFGIPMSHAWAVDNKTGKVVDPTWSSRNNLSPGKSYFGIAFSTDYLRKTIFDTGVWGLIPDYPTDNYNPMKDGFPDSAFHKKSFSVDKIDLDSIKDKPKDRNAYHYIEDYLIGGNVKAWGIYFKEGNANSGNHDHAGRPGHVGGSGTGGTRNKTDDEIRQNIQDQRLLASVYGDSNKKYELHFEGMTVADRLKFMEMNAKKESEGDLGDIPPEFAYTKYDFELQKEIPKGFNADQLRTYLKENNLIRDPKGVPDTFYPTFYLKGSDLTKGLSDAEKDEFIEEFPKSSKRAIDDGKYQVEISPDPEMGLSIKQWEKLSDNFDTASGYNGLKLKDGEIDWSDRMYLQKRALGEFSQDKEAALTALLSGWAMSGGGISAQKIIREVSAGLFPVNKGVLFYDSSEPGIDPGKKLYSKTRMAEHFAALKIETEDFYKKKFAKKSDPNPDLSMKTIDVWRGVGGHFDDYIPAAAESWSAQKSSANKFGKMTAQGGRSWGSRSEGKYTLVAAKISYNDVLWSYESVKGKYGWPSDKKLKGKKEFVVIGGALKLGNTTVENLYD